MNLLEVHTECEFMKVNGFIGKPVISRGNRNFESYFINQRYIKSSLVAKGIEDAYKLHLMQHQYPFTVLHPVSYTHLNMYVMGSVLCWS